MTYDLIIGDYAYSSWSLRGWLLFEKFNIPRKVTLLDFDSKASVAEQLATHAPARTVPTIRTPDGAIISESYAIAEDLADRHPDAGIWPSTPKHRSIARSLAAEMHSGFAALRSVCPMNLRTAFDWATPSPDVLADLIRIETLWDWARDACGTGEGDWLCGDYSAADAMYAPVAMRIAGYNLPVSDAARAYVDLHLNDLALRRWRAMGLVHGAHLSRYDQPHPERPWPGPAVLEATVSDAVPVNAQCPYSGKPSTHMLELEGTVYGFCNAFCRDKTLADPDAWPAFTDLRARQQKSQVVNG
ncbi:glutathione S-transferase N-terminal domain-containing protein [Cognatishimia maritima]|uniref:Glutathione S-transferase n=1 Tax=Cognatishimia maritima TaxID=870908 RepID=A0A1M5RZT2_9RHOB|nr:glutathione S-transferase N-terminal domain-containing protein [Cognatishimia maritima]SHH31872.1 glutathione S-transferase [Cognatishimia maritima]